MRPQAGGFGTQLVVPVPKPKAKTNPILSARRQGHGTVEVNLMELIKRDGEPDSSSDGSHHGGHGHHKGRRGGFKENVKDWDEGVEVGKRASLCVDQGSMMERTFKMNQMGVGLDDNVDPEFERKRRSKMDAEEISLDTEELERLEEWARIRELRRQRLRKFIRCWWYCLKCLLRLLWDTFVEPLLRKKEKEMLKRNAWVTLPNRPARLHRLRQKRKELQAKIRGIERREKGWMIKIWWHSFQRGLGHTWKDLWYFLYENVLSRVDASSGLPARLLETWEFKEKVHDGPHGWVFKALDRQGNRVAVKIRDKSRGHVMQLPLDIAIKTLRKEGVTKRLSLQQVLIRLGLASPLKHPYLVEVHAIMDNQEFFVEVVEWCTGGSLSEMLEDMDQQLDEWEACRVFTQILAGLRFLHHRRLVHRDVRLCQVLLTKGGRSFDVKLGDFWCIARIRKNRGFLTSTNMPGDVATLAPEVIKTGEWTDKADIWSAGCMLFEMLYGHPPYGGEGEALVQRICTLDAEFDGLCESVSDNGKDLLRQMLRRKVSIRPSTKDCLKHKWIYEFSMDQKDRGIKGAEHKIRKVKVDGKQPPARRGMSVDNLLSAKTGMFNAGFCTFMGATQCQMDFEIGGPEDWQMYWLSSILVSFWGTHDNPHGVTLYAALRANGVHSEITRIKVGSPDETEARLVANKPIRYLRLSFRENFGGIYGIAIRKLTFYGYEVRPIPILANLDKCLYTKGAESWWHTEDLKETDVNKEVHKSLRSWLIKGARVVGTGQRYMKYRDIYSGPEHTTTSVGVYIHLEPGMNLIAATLALRYAAHSEPQQTPPRLRIAVETQDAKIVIFHSGDLVSHRVNRTKDVLPKGYDDLPPVYSGEFSIPTDEPFLLEVQFENNSGYVHIPIDFGLTFYHVPDVPTPCSESDEEHNQQEMAAMVVARGRRTGDIGDVDAIANFVEEKKKKEEEEKKARRTDMDLFDEEKQSSHFESDQYEEVLHRDLKDLQDHVTFGAWGASDFDAGDIPPWQPASKKSVLKGEEVKSKEEPGWWEIPSTPSSSSGSEEEHAIVEEVVDEHEDEYESGEEEAADEFADILHDASEEGSYETGTTGRAAPTDASTKAPSSRADGEGGPDAWGGERRPTHTEKDAWFDELEEEKKRKTAAVDKATQVKRARQEDQSMKGQARAAAREQRREERAEARRKWLLENMAEVQNVDDVNERAVHFAARARLKLENFVQAAQNFEMPQPAENPEDDTLIGRLLVRPLSEKQKQLTEKCVSVEREPTEQV
mmetsp:Transcript_15011/g.28173  ORF Transcript_15011/g.28173 Transcript_15011/m.28173 type:complete len:1276 (+) Transcript_15011:3-3830(+)